jgi:VWFA-related protein
MYRTFLFANPLNRLKAFRLVVMATTLGLCLSVAHAQEKKPPQNQKPPEADDVVRVNTELVQTDVMVFDKKGRFVDGLQRDQFQLYVDGKPEPISFFESVIAGSSGERASLKKARGEASPASSEASSTAKEQAQGRTVMFFVDDMHLAPGNLLRTRKSILYFIDNLMGENDQVAITSASGQIGFLQQLTGNKAVLRAAVERLSAVAARGRDYQQPPISEYQAYLIVEQMDRAGGIGPVGNSKAPIATLFDYFVDQTMKANNVPAAIATALVEQRTRMIVQQSDAALKVALSSLIALMRGADKLAGRKLVFFISDGFVSNFTGSDVTTTLRRAIDGAASAGVVIYSIDARGLTVDSYLDASNGGGFDPSGVLMSRATGELAFTQEGMVALAADTGGRTLFNSNSMTDGMGKALDETSRYYLLAWRPKTAQQHASPKVRIEIAGHPDWKVQLRRGHFGQRGDPGGTKRGPAIMPSSAEELSATDNAITDQEVPTSLFLGHKQIRGGGSMQLTAAIQVLGQVSSDSGKDTADVFGAVFDSGGKAVGSFKQRTNLLRAASAEQPAFANVNYELKVAPGLYQVSIVTRDNRTQHLGRAMDWIEIPQLKPGLSLSSVYLGEVPATADATGASATQVGINASRRFARTSRLRFTSYIYGVTRGATPPDIGVKVEILRGNQIVSAPPEQKIAANKSGDLSSIPYSGEFAVTSLPVGRYVLQITAVDHATNANASQQIKFTVY